MASITQYNYNITKKEKHLHLFCFHAAIHWNLDIKLNRVKTASGTV